MWVDFIHSKEGLKKKECCLKTATQKSWLNFQLWGFQSKDWKIYSSWISSLLSCHINFRLASPTNLWTNFLKINQSINQSVYLSLYLPIYNVPIYLSINHLSICLSIVLFLCPWRTLIQSISSTWEDFLFLVILAYQLILKSGVEEN